MEMQMQIGNIETRDERNWYRACVGEFGGRDSGGWTGKILKWDGEKWGWIGYSLALAFLFSILLSLASFSFHANLNDPSVAKWFWNLQPMKLLSSGLKNCKSEILWKMWTNEILKAKTEILINAKKEENREPKLKRRKGKWNFRDNFY